MMNEEIESPLENQLNSGDPGDDTLRRFRYQITYAAILSLNLLEQNSNYEMLYCEHYEDILACGKNGKYVAFQIKTRLNGRPMYKTDDEDILKSLKRFCLLEHKHPDKFVKYVISTNHFFWREKDNRSNLFYLIQICQGEDCQKNFASKQPLSVLLNKLKSKDNPITPELLLRVMRKLDLDDSLPKFEDIETRLHRSLRDLEAYNDQLAIYHAKAAEQLIYKMFNASSLNLDPVKLQYAILAPDPACEKTRLTIEGKRITKEALQRIIDDSISQPITLQSLNYIPISELPSGMDLLDTKMTAGKINSLAIDTTKDLYNSLIYLFIKWRNKFGNKKASEMLDEIKVIVRNECQEAYDTTYIPDSTFGMDMLNKLRVQLRERAKTEKESLFGCKYEHLLGAAGALTEECQVWWSDKFDLVGDA